MERVQIFQLQMLTAKLFSNHEYTHSLMLTELQLDQDAQEQKEKEGKSVLLVRVHLPP